MPPPRRPTHPHRTRPHKQSCEAKSSVKDHGWDPVAAWYDKLVGETGSDYHKNVIIPAALRLLEPKRDECIIDVCCGQGVLVKSLLDSGVSKITGVDASRRLIESAKIRHGNDSRVSLIVADACKRGPWVNGTNDAATCIMAVHDVPNLLGLSNSISQSLKPGGRAVFIFMHPCFRIPKKSHWGWDGDQKIQYRRLDSYGKSLEITITTHPGKGSSEETTYYHRPLADLLTEIGKAGLAVIACEELYSHRRSQGNGPFSKAEHAAAEEFPMFIALKAIRVS